MPERQLPSTLDILDCQCVGRAWDVVVPGCLLGISLNTHASTRHGKNSFHQPARAVLLQCDAVWLEECRATYQRLVIKMFRPLLGKTMEVYNDDMLVKSKERLDHAEHMLKAFELIRGYEMKLNPSK